MCLEVNLEVSLEVSLLLRPKDWYCLVFKVCFLVQFFASYLFTATKRECIRSLFLVFRTYSRHRLNGFALLPFLFISFPCLSFLFTAREGKYIRSLFLFALFLVLIPITKLMDVCFNLLFWYYFSVILFFLQQERGNISDLFAFFFFFCFVSRTYSHHKMNGYMLLSFILIFLCNSFLFTARDRRYIRSLFCFDFRTYSHHRINGYALLFFFFSFLLCLCTYYRQKMKLYIFFTVTKWNNIRFSFFIL